jgi:phytol kinase
MTLIFYVALSVLLIFLLLVASEIWWRKRKPHDEFSRKFIHIFVGSFAAFWPFYLTWGWIVALSASFVVVVTLSKYLGVFKSIHAVERPTWGEVYFALAVGALAFVTHDPWIYAVALLHMSLADGLAAVTGVTWGKGTFYKIFGHRKSFVGSLTFFVISVGLLASYSAMPGHSVQPSLIFGLAGLATVIENISGYGLDNLLIPLLIGVVLTLP